MTKYVCTVCGYVYDPEAGDPDNGIAPGTAWEDVPEDWVCPLCAVGKDMFEAQQRLFTILRINIKIKREVAADFSFFIENKCFYAKNSFAINTTARNTIKKEISLNFPVNAFMIT